MARLELQGICKGWDYPILDELDLTIEEGEFFCILGPSGISKTTLLRIVAGLESPDAGRVILNGKDITDVPPYHRPVALTFESYALYPHRSVFDNIASPLRAQKLPRSEIEARIGEVARILRIEELLPRRPNEASGGQMQRISLARTLVKRPEGLPPRRADQSSRRADSLRVAPAVPPSRGAPHRGDDLRDPRLHRGALAGRPGRHHGSCGAGANRPAAGHLRAAELALRGPTRGPASDQP